MLLPALREADAAGLPAGPRGDGARVRRAARARLRRRRRRDAGVRRRRRARQCAPPRGAPGRRRVRALDGGASELRRARARRARRAARDLERPDDRPAAGRAHAGAGDRQLVAGRGRHARQPARPGGAALRDGDGLAGGRRRDDSARPQRARGRRRIRAARSVGPARRPVGARVPGRGVDRGRARAARRRRARRRRRGARRGVRRGRRGSGRTRARRPRRPWLGAAGGAGRRAERPARAGAPRPRRLGRRRRRDRQLPLGGAALEPEDRDHRVPRSLAPHGRGDPGLLHRRPADRTRARDRAGALGQGALLRVLHTRSARRA